MQSEQTVSGVADARDDKGVVSHVAARPAAPTIHFRALDMLRDYANNPRKHSDEQIEQIAASIVTFGWTVPVLEDATGTVAGHGRAMAARWLYENVGCSLEFPDGTPIPFGCVPVLPCDGWDEDRRRAYVIADNQLANNAGWDDDKLAAEFQALMQHDFDTSVLGFSDDVSTVLGGGFVQAPSHPINDKERNTLLVEFDSEQSLQAAFTELQERGWDVKIMS